MSAHKCKLMIAIDQGGSKTEVAILSSNAELLYRANDRDIRLLSGMDFESGRWDYIYMLIKRSLDIISASIDDVGYLLAALCGADWKEDNIVMREKLSERLGIAQNRIFIVNDCEAALRACLPFFFKTKNCAILYAGTRFNSSIMTESGLSYTYGRFVNNDDHGAYAIGLSVWRTVLDSYNGFRGSTEMIKMLLDLTHSESLPDYIKEITSNRKIFTPVLFSSILFDALKLNDSAATDILDSFVKRWVKYVTSGIKKVGLPSEAKLDVYLSGGVFKNCTRLWINRITEELRFYGSNISCCLAKYEPIVGAELLLLEHVFGCPLNDLVLDKVSNTLFLSQ